MSQSCDGISGHHTHKVAHTCGASLRSLHPEGPSRIPEVCLTPVGDSYQACAQAEAMAGSYRICREAMDAGSSGLPDHE